MQLTFCAVDEEEPGEKFRRCFRESWPYYRRWWLAEGEEARPTYHACRQAMKAYMPELTAAYDRWCELAGGGDHEARFLSLYCPPRYLSACSQAVWPGHEPMLVRNYDYDPNAFDARVLRSRWLGARAIMGMSDCLVGLLDGINDAGLAVSLTFGGSRLVGEGFAVTIILRYVLETCETAGEAGRALRRVPCHMPYNVTALDRDGRYLTAMMAPGRETVVTNAPVATNHQERVEWSAHARATASVERERFLLQRLTLRPESSDRFIAAFLRPPLYSTAFARGFGTLYTAQMRGRSGELTLHWPAASWVFRLDGFREGTRTIRYVANEAAV